MARYPLGAAVTLSTKVTDPTTGLPADPTDISLQLRLPDGTTLVRDYSPGPVVRDSTGAFHDTLTTGPAGTLTSAGAYRWEWLATGSAPGAVTGSFLIVDPFALPDTNIWRPARPSVAKYVPERTLAANQLSDTPLGDFTDLTTPTAAQADDHIDAAVSWVALRTGVLDSSLYQDASEVVAIRAAGMIELAYPVRDADINTAQALLAQADVMIERLVLANEATSPTTSAPGLLSAWAFPDPAPWGDRLDIW